MDARFIFDTSSPAHFTIPHTICIVRLPVTGVTLGLEDKLIIATKLAALGVDVCEAGVS